MPLSRTCNPSCRHRPRRCSCRHCTCGPVALPLRMSPVVSLSHVHLSHRRCVCGLSRRVAHVAGCLIVTGTHLLHSRRARCPSSRCHAHAPIMPPLCVHLSCRCCTGAPVASLSCAWPVTSCRARGWAVRTTRCVAVALCEHGHVGGGGSAQAGAWVGSWVRGWGGCGWGVLWPVALRERRCVGGWWKRAGRQAGGWGGHVARVCHGPSHCHRTT